MARRVLSIVWVDMKPQGLTCSKRRQVCHDKVRSRPSKLIKLNGCTSNRERRGLSGDMVNVRLPFDVMHTGTDATWLRFLSLPRCWCLKRGREPSTEGEMC